MKDSLRPGVAITRRCTADADKCISFLGDDLRVYATPAIVADMEYTCRDLLLPHLDDGQNSVGARVEINHIAPTLMGMDVDIAAEITAVKGRLITFSFTVRDSVEEVANGSHVRFIVDIDKTAERLAAKRQKATG